MSKNTSISLSEHFSEFVDSQVETGKYASASEVVRAGLRLLEEHEAYVAAVQVALIEGEQSGEPRPFDVKAMISEKRRKYA
ncbi:MAG: type II toxin-antitoxin system ParD family antitoxin [Pseudaminobacter sp.]|nr:type II toxin-antitoxin system ParD family antitoxin [Pseudaminobacter sp.]